MTTSLSLVEKSNKEISVIIGLVLWSVRRWTKKCRDVRDTDLPLQKKRTVKTHLTFQVTLKLQYYQVLQFQPHISARELKEKNSKLLQDISVCTIQRILRKDLHFMYPAPWRKPILTILQRKKKIIFCLKDLVWEPEKWKKVLSTDKVNFTMIGNSGMGGELQTDSNSYHPSTPRGLWTTHRVS